MALATATTLNDSAPASGELPDAGPQSDGAPAEVCGPAVVEIQRVSKTYFPAAPWKKGVQALDDVTLSITEGEVFGLAGPNRAGKSTLLKVVLSLCHPDSGSISRFGQDGDCRRTLSRVGYVNESQVFPLYLSANELLTYYGAVSQLSPGLLRRRIPELLEQVDLADRRRERIANFSKGMLRRLALAQALLNEPDLLVLDEPTAGLDQFGRELFRSVIRQQRRAGKTTLLVSHDLTDMARLCRRIGVIVNGRLAAVGSVSELATDPESGAPCTVEAALARICGGTEA